MNAFAIWLTGLPASGKSSITAALKPKLEALGHRVEVLESDVVRRALTPSPTYSREERDLFYRALAYLGSRLVAQGVSVVFDATANKRAYRDLARQWITVFIEVAVQCPLAVCEQRDRKGTYKKGKDGASATVPGLQEAYESPLHPEVTIDTQTTDAEAASAQIVKALKEHLSP